MGRRSQYLENSQAGPTKSVEIQGLLRRKNFAKALRFGIACAAGRQQPAIVFTMDSGAVWWTDSLGTNVTSSYVKMARNNHMQPRAACCSGISTFAYFCFVDIMTS